MKLFMFAIDALIALIILFGFYKIALNIFLPEYVKQYKDQKQRMKKVDKELKRVSTKN